MVRSLVIKAGSLVLAAVALSALTDRPAGAPAWADDGLDWTTILDRVPFGAFKPVDPGHAVAFPADHGAHAGSPADGWNVAAHLETADGAHVGFQLSMARVALVGPGAPPPATEWELRELWRGQATLAQGGAQSALGEERIRRGFPGIAGYDGERLELRLDDWALQFAEGDGAQPVQVIASIGPAATIELDLVPEKAVVTPGPGAAAPFTGYAVTRLRAVGTLTTTEGEEPVSGVAWLEHLWGDLPFPGGPTATDRLLLHLDDGSDLSITRTRRRDGGGTASVDGFVVRPDGEVAPLPENTALAPWATWGPEGGDAEYPVRWALALDGARLEIAPVIDGQLHGFLTPMWSGIVTVEGTSAAGRVSGVGTLQLQGYEDR